MSAPATEVATPETPDTPGLRERKRLATRRAIQLAAMTVVRERGVEGTTVDEIARIADVSPRTFFNYFSSKEEAIVGDGPEMPPDDAQARFIADRSPILPALAELFASSITPALADQELVQLRRTLMKSIPDLGARRWATMHRFEGEIAELVARRLAHQHPELEADQRELTRQARLTTFIAIGAMRHAWLTWMEDNGDQGALIERMRDSFAAVPTVLGGSASA